MVFLTRPGAIGVQDKASAVGDAVLLSLGEEGAVPITRAGCWIWWSAGRRLRGSTRKFRATDLSENDAKQQAVDLNVTFKQYGQRNDEDRCEPRPSVPD